MDKLLIIPRKNTIQSFLNEFKTFHPEIYKYYDLQHKYVDYVAV